jgi:predicted benzoate:H+ symporter BenE
MFYSTDTDDTNVRLWNKQLRDHLIPNIKNVYLLTSWFYGPLRNFALFKTCLFFYIICLRLPFFTFGSRISFSTSPIHLNPGHPTFSLTSALLSGSVLITLVCIILMGARGSVVVKALCCKPEGRGIASRWGGFFSNLPNPFGSRADNLAAIC